MNDRIEKIAKSKPAAYEIADLLGDAGCINIVVGESNIEGVWGVTTTMPNNPFTRHRVEKLLKRDYLKALLHS